jgi:hypothetical protein
MIVFKVHGFLCYVLQKLGYTSLNHIGEYGDPPNKYIWAAQCSVYITSLMINKIIVCAAFIATLKPVNDFADWLFSPLWPTPELELVVVMILCPFLLTSLQFLMFDYMLKAPPHEDKDNVVSSSLLQDDRGITNSKGSITSDEGSHFLSIDFASGLPSTYVPPKGLSISSLHATMDGDSDNKV